HEGGDLARARKDGEQARGQLGTGNDVADVVVEPWCRTGDEGVEQRLRRLREKRRADELVDAGKDPERDQMGASEALRGDARQSAPEEEDEGDDLGLDASLVDDEGVEE